MGLIKDLTPLNLLEEKEKFFKDNSYNPQFKYIRKFSKTELYQYGFPKAKFVAYAEAMLKKHQGNRHKKAVFLDKSYVKKQIKETFKRLNLKPVEVYFSPDFSFSAMLSKEGLFFREPVRLSKEELTAKLNHEIQTHFLRRLNQNQNIKKNFNDIKDDAIKLKKTEEGLASLNYYLAKKNKLIKKAFTGYYTLYLAQQYSFAKSFAILQGYKVRDQIAWNVLVQKKRGLEDTSQPGGFTKDLVYLEGMVKVAKWILKTETPELLYAGRISIEKLEQIKNDIDQSQIILPTFLANHNYYLKQIKKIVKTNQLQKLF